MGGTCSVLSVGSYSGVGLDKSAEDMQDASVRWMGSWSVLSISAWRHCHCHSTAILSRVSVRGRLWEVSPDENWDEDNLAGDGP